MSFEIKFAGTPYSCVAQEGQTILEAAEKANLKVPSACRSGACGCCKVKVISGKVDLGQFQPFALTEKDREQNLVLMCKAIPLSNLELSVSQISCLDELKNKNIAVKIVEKALLTPEVIRLVVERQDQNNFSFTPGQFFDFVLPDNHHRSYSVSSSKNETRSLEFLIRKVPNGFFTSLLFDEKLNVGHELTLEGPHGNFTFDSKPGFKSIFLATGTGIAPVKSIVGSLIENRDLEHQDIYIYWGARHTKDLFISSLLQEWSSNHPQIHFIPVVSRDDQWSGIKGHVQTQAAIDHGDMTHVNVYASGSNSLIKSAGNFLMVRCGLPENRFKFDDFGGQHN